MACTLTDAARRERLTWIRETVVAGSTLARRSARDLALDVPRGLVEQARTLVALESECCAFLNLELREHGDGTARLAVSGPPGSESILDAWTNGEAGHA